MLFKSTHTETLLLFPTTTGPKIQPGKLTAMLDQIIYRQDVNGVKEIKAFIKQNPKN